MIFQNIQIIKRGNDKRFVQVGASSDNGMYKLLPQVVALLDTYHLNERDTLLPTISYETYRFLLKALQLRAGIAIPLTAYMTRHSFGTLTLEAGMPLLPVHKSVLKSRVARFQGTWIG